MTRIATIALAVSAALLAPAFATAQAPAGPTLDDLSFMAGCWRSESGDGAALEEFYTAPSENLILGASRYPRGGRHTDGPDRRRQRRFDGPGVAHAAGALPPGRELTCRYVTVPSAQPAPAERRRDCTTGGESVVKADLRFQALLQ